MKTLRAFIFLMILALNITHVGATTDTVTNVTELESAWGDLDDGDVLFIAAGTYTVTSSMNFYIEGKTDIQIIGDGKDVTILDFSNANYGFIIYKTQMSFSDLAIQNAAKYGAVYAIGAKAVFPPYTCFYSVVDFDNVLIDGCTSDYDGGAVCYGDYAYPTSITNSAFINNESTSGGGAIYLKSIEEDLNIVSCSFANNTSSSTGGAIYFDDASSSAVTIEQCKFANNTSDGCGSAIYANSITSLILENNEIFNNSGGYAIYFYPSSTSGAFSIINNTIAKNDNGGCCFGSSFENYSTVYGGLIDNNVFADNGSGSYDIKSSVSQSLSGYNNVIENVGTNITLSGTNNTCDFDETLYSVSGTTLSMTSTGVRYVTGKVLRSSSSCPSVDINGTTRNSIITDAGAEELDLKDYTSVAIWIGGSSSTWTTSSNWRDSPAISSGSLNGIGKIMILHNSSGNYPSVPSTETISADELYMYPATVFQYSGSNLTLGDVTVRSDASGTGQFINNGGTISGTQVYEQYLTGGQWNYLFIPEDVTANNLFPDLDFGEDWSTGDYWIAKYDGESRANNGTATSNWVNITSGATTLEANTGYIVWVDEAQVVEFDCVPNGNVSYSVDKLQGTADSSNWGWNLIGNPYSIALSSDEVLSNNTSITGGLYIKGEGDDYETRVGGIGDAEYIPAHQAFFIQTDTTADFTLQTNDAVFRTDIIFKTASISEKKLLTITVNDGTKDCDNTYLRIKEDCSDNFDGNYDTYKWANRSTKYLGIRSSLNDIDYDINSFNIETGESKTIPLYITMPDTLNSLTMTFSLEGLESDESVYLVNNVSGLMTKLSDGYELFVDMENSTSISEQYSLTFIKNDLVTGVIEKSDLDEIRVYSSDNILWIESDNICKNINAIVYDMYGKKVAQCTVEGGKGSVNNLHSGLHVIITEQNNEFKSYKIMIQ